MLIAGVFVGSLGFRERAAVSCKRVFALRLPYVYTFAHAEILYQGGSTSWCPKAPTVLCQRSGECQGLAAGSTHSLGCVLPELLSACRVKPLGGMETLNILWMFLVFESLSK